MNIFPRFSGHVGALLRATALAALFFASSALADEEIRHFDSRIEVRSDGDLVVTETIRVQAEGDKINHGIYRDFPTLYSGPGGLKTSVPFEVLEVQRDGRPEPWHSANKANGVRVYIGASNVMVPHGESTYTLKYRTGRQVGFFADFDELYWNVTGDGWDFPILSASACVSLPDGATARSIEAYTGRKGAKGQAFRVVGHPGCAAAIESTAPLYPGEGLTIAVTWPKGFVQAPTPESKAMEVVSSNLGVALGSIGLLGAFLYFLASWFLVGRDPGHGVIIPLFAPPQGFTPQDVRYLRGMGTFDNTSFSAAIMNLAVARSLKITEPKKRHFQLERIDGNPPDEEGICAALFGKGKTLALEQTNHATLSQARNLLGKHVARKIGPCFSRNTGVWVIGLVVTLIPLAISLLDAKEIGGAVFMMLWLSIWSIGCAALSLSVFSAWRGPNKWTAIPLTLFSIPFLGGWIFGLWALVQATSPWVCGLYVFGIALCAVFQHLLKRPTQEGQALRDQISGFREYLSVAEAERLGLENPPERTPELFEKFLPYALALGVEQAWSEKFADVLQAASQVPDSDSTHVSLPLAFTSAAVAGALTSAISSASTAPGSSSGSGGGGSSGGGGGGGGGGGW